MQVKEAVVEEAKTVLHALVGINPNDRHKEGLKRSEKLGLLITNAVGTMQCAFIFTLIALVGLPGAISGGLLTIVQWVAQTFLQLVLLSVIMVGQNVQSKRSEIKAEVDHHTLEYLRRINDQQLEMIKKVDKVLAR